jgi:hypothetical protein
MIDSNIVRFFFKYIRICTRMPHIQYAVVNRTYIEIRILKP